MSKTFERWWDERPIHYTPRDAALAAWRWQGDTVEDLRRQLAEVERDRDELAEFVNEVRRNGDTRLASMAIAALAKLGADKMGEV